MQYMAWHAVAWHAFATACVSAVLMGSKWSRWGNTSPLQLSFHSCCSGTWQLSLTTLLDQCQLLCATVQSHCWVQRDTLAAKGGTTVSGGTPYPRSTNCWRSLRKCTWGRSAATLQGRQRRGQGRVAAVSSTSRHMIAFTQGQNRRVMMSSKA